MEAEALLRGALQLLEPPPTEQRSRTLRSLSGMSRDHSLLGREKSMAKSTFGSIFRSSKDKSLYKGSSLAREKSINKSSVAGGAAPVFCSSPFRCRGSGPSDSPVGTGMHPHYRHSQAWPRPQSQLRIIV